MNDRLKKALDQVQAEEELKQKTKEYVFQKANVWKRTKKSHFKLFLPAAACTLLMFLGGYWLYFVPTAEISMDMEEAMETDTAGEAICLRRASEKQETEKGSAFTVSCFFEV